MKVRNFTLICVSLLLLNACDQLSNKHEIVRVGNNTYLLNKATGETKIIDGTKLVAVKTPELTAGIAKVWPEDSMSMLQGVKFKMRTKYRDGRMLWHVEAGPFSGVLEKSFNKESSPVLPAVFFILLDSDNFETGNSVEMLIKDGMRVVGDNKQIEALNWSGSQAMTAEEYLSISVVSMGLRGI